MLYGRMYLRIFIRRSAAWVSLIGRSTTLPHAWACTSLGPSRRGIATCETNRAPCREQNEQNFDPRKSHRESEEEPPPRKPTGKTENVPMRRREQTALSVNSRDFLIRLNSGVYRGFAKFSISDDCLFNDSPADNSFHLNWMNDGGKHLISIIVDFNLFFTFYITRKYSSAGNVCFR